MVSKNNKSRDREEREEKERRKKMKQEGMPKGNKFDTEVSSRATWVLNALMLTIAAPLLWQITSILWLGAEFTLVLF